MAQYVDKAVLVAEIERKRSDYINSFMTEQVHVLNDVLDFLDTLEVIEIGVDVGSPEGDLGKKTVIDADGNISEVTFNKAQKGE